LKFVYYQNISKNACNVDPSNFVTETIYRLEKLSVPEVEFAVTAEVVECCALSCRSVLCSSSSAVQRDTHHYHLGYTRSVMLFICIIIVQLILQSNTGLHKLICVYGNTFRKSFAFTGGHKGFKTSKDSYSKEC